VLPSSASRSNQKAGRITRRAISQLGGVPGTSQVLHRAGCSAGVLIDPKLKILFAEGGINWVVSTFAGCRMTATLYAACSTTERDTAESLLV